MLKQRLTEKGVVVTGNSRAIAQGSLSATPLVEIAKIESPPLALIAAKTMKPSQNMYTETLLWTLGEDERKRALIAPGIQSTSSELGITVVKNFLTGIGIAPDAIVQYDGSGLSRHNLITPAAVVQLYSYMGTKSKYSQAWRDSLTIAGVDGTLRNRFKGTRGEANVRGKTGTIDQVSALSGYLTTAGGEQLVFSMLVNGVTQNSTRVGLIDEIVLMLANFNGKLEQ
jgi:D-alanyl-D-alanine carboxypeptidase/D-alanyl-D-alanine-endopeptidase (penicillin-binding protein 4)